MSFSQIAHGAIFFSGSQGVFEVIDTTFNNILSVDAEDSPETLSTVIFKAESFGNQLRTGGTSELYINLTNLQISNCRGWYLINTTNVDGREDFRMSQTTISNSQGNVFYATNAFIDIQDCVFSSIQGRSGTIVQAFFGTEVTISSTTITGVSADEYGGVFFISDSGSSLTATTIQVTNCSAPRGGVFFVEKNSYVLAEDSQFSQNSANSGSLMYMTITSDTENFSRMKNCEINNNNGGGLVFIFDGQLVIEGWEVSSNHSTELDGSIGQSPGFELIRAKLISEQSSFSHHKGIGGCFFTAQVESQILDSGSTFSHGECEYGAMAYLLDSKAEFIGTTFKNYFSGEAAAINSERSDLRFEDCTFVNFTSGTSDSTTILELQYNSLEITNWEMSDFNATAMSLNSLTETSITNLKIHDGGNSETVGGAVYFEGWEQVQIVESEFYNLQALYGAGIYFQGEKYISNPVTKIIRNTEFYDNVAFVQGGAIWAKDDLVQIDSCNFTTNSAPGYGDQDEGDGGALWLNCETISTQCISTINSTLFDGNKANHNGGAILWLDDEPLLVNNTMQNNTASYGPDVASYAETIEAVGSRRLDLSNLASGQTLSEKLAYALFDRQRQIVTTDSESECSWASSSNNATISGTTKVTTEAGVCTFDNLIITASPGSDASFQLLTTGINAGKVGAANAIIDINTTLRYWTYGEILTSTNACLLCEDNTYSIELDAAICKACKDEAECFGGAEIYPRAEYWRTKKLSDQFFRCFRPESCIGHEEQTSDTGACADGYEGNLCQGWKDEWSQTTKNTCQPCPDPEINAIRVSGIALAVLLLVVLMVRSTMRSASKPKELHSVMLRIFMNYLQLVVLTASFNLDWPKLVQELLNIQDTAGSITTQVFSFDWYLESAGPDVEIVYQKMMIMAVLPVFVLIITAGFWLIVLAIKRDLGVMRNQFVTTMIVLLFLAHPPILQSMFSAFACYELDDGEFWLMQDMNIRCWVEEHLSYTFTIALPGIIIWGIGIPTLALVLVYRSRSVLELVVTKSKYGFLYMGYNMSHYYWEFIILYRKICIIFISVFLAAISTQIQALAVIFVIAMAFFYHNIQMPYETKSLNVLESRSIVVSGITIYCGLYFMSGELNTGAEYAFFAIIVATNTYFLFFWLFRMSEALFIKFAKKKPELAKKLCRCWPSLVQAANESIQGAIDNSKASVNPEDLIYKNNLNFERSTTKLEADDYFSKNNSSDYFLTRHAPSAEYSDKQNQMIRTEPSSRGTQGSNNLYVRE